MIPSPVSKTTTHEVSSFALSMGIAEHDLRVNTSSLVLELCERVNHANLSVGTSATVIIEEVNAFAFASNANRND